jgi:hypothetical protein
MTAAARVTGRNEISIGGQTYKTTRPVQVAQSQLPAKVVIGEVTSAAGPLSVIRWKSGRGGIGKKDHEDSSDVERLWYGTSHIRVAGHTTLPDRPTTTAASGVTGVFTVGAMGNISNAIHAAFGTSIRKYAGTDSWGSELQAMSSGATDSINCRLSDVEYLIFTNNTNYYYTSNGSTYTTVNIAAEYMACWDDRLWGIDNTGQLRWAFDPTGTWTDDAQLPLPNDYVQDLFVGRDGTGAHILYASTKVGLFSHDLGNAKFHQTEMELPFHDDAGRGVARFRDATYIPAGLGAYKYSLGGSGAVITTVGPDRDQGLPSNRRGKIVQLLSSHNDLIALVDNTTVGASGSTARVSTGMSTHHRAIHGGIASGRSLILGWNELGWQVLWESGEDEQAIDTALVSGAYGEYRLWWAQNERVHWITLPVDVVNPAEITDREYADASRDELPWLSDDAEFLNLAVRLTVEVEGASSTETVTPYIGLDGDDDSWTALAAITSDGFHVYTLPNTTAGVTTKATGTAFRSIRIRRDLANGTNNQKTPDVRSITLEYRKKIPARLTFSAELDLYRNERGTPLEQRALLVAAQAANLAQEVTYRDDDGDDRNYYCDIAQVSALEETGHDERGISRVTLVQL